MNRALVAALAAAVVIAAVLGVTWYLAFRSEPGDLFADCRGGVVGAGAIGGPFELTDGQGRVVTDRDVITGPTLIYFGYTFCPDVCPLDTARNGEAVDLLEKRGIVVTPVFISIDPERDTPEIVDAFAKAMHPRMIGLTGTPEQVKAAADAYKVYFKANRTDEADEYYLVDHSTFTYLVLPEFGFVDFIRRDESPEEVADKVACFVEAAKRADPASN